MDGRLLSAKKAHIWTFSQLTPSGVLRYPVPKWLFSLYNCVVTDWCVKKGKISDTQFGFFPGRSTLHPLFILRHLRHAAKKLKPRKSPRLHVAFIDFLQAYDTVPRQQLWSHLCSAMPSTLLSVIKHMYENDEYILMDGEKRARVHPTNGVNRGALCPPSFSLCTSMTWAERSVRVP